jgi:hypothetical protein
MRTILVVLFLGAGIGAARADRHSCLYDVARRLEACLRWAAETRQPDSVCDNIKEQGRHCDRSGRIGGKARYAQHQASDR